MPLALVREPRDVRDRQRTLNCRGHEGDTDLQRVVELLRNGGVDLEGSGVFEPVLQAMLSPHDPWMTIADCRSYADAQTRAAAVFRNRDR
jgi:starch phosphorylase